MQYDVIVIGAGAAGLMCAATAGQRGRRVLLLHHARKLAEKIRISGGGRCNFTNLHARFDCYLSANPHFCRSALAQYTPQDFIAMVERHGIGYHEKNWASCSATRAASASSRCWTRSAGWARWSGAWRYPSSK